MSGVSAGARGVPDPRLRPYVARYDGYLLRGFAPGFHVGMPMTCLTVIITIDEPIDLPVSSHPAQPGGTWDALASGLTLRPCLIAHRGYQHGIQLALTPLGSRALFGVPVAELGSWVVDLADLLGARVGELRERLASTPDWSARFAVLDEILLRRIGEIDPDANLEHAWRLLTASPLPPRVGAVADEIGWSRRHLAGRFTAEFGISPKDAARLARFEASHRMLRRAGTTIATVAATTGYYDQAHMAREWRELAGMPPSRWLASEEFPFVQAQDRAPLEGSHV
ncbi:helix-turn-helix domain-containing protein [Nocardia terpenica]|uniref:Helix-turn-helix domain-containing protein n=1 Tax=Nocardia terpenica TaxID=455432 RepID=A0A6G9ZAA0_9NOCA|nr:AraC family transcriptional regulator [Nocardia terpenica]QIS22468.1 helix-turn-helix domain-containing protein [Nocardia terpenica]